MELFQHDFEPLSDCHIMNKWFSACHVCSRVSDRLSQPLECADNVFVPATGRDTIAGQLQALLSWKFAGDIDRRAY
eukprot:6231604-Amphidinium_carterae.2